MFQRDARGQILQISVNTMARTLDRPNVISSESTVEFEGKGLSRLGTDGAVDGPGGTIEREITQQLIKLAAATISLVSISTRPKAMLRSGSSDDNGSFGA